MMGYWERPEETRKAVVDGWMHTGDGGYMDEDGYVYVVDRIKDMIISGGENVYSAEVENCVAQHPAVAQCAVIGIPDAKWGEAVHAVVMRKPGAAVTGDDDHRLLQGADRALQVPAQRSRAGRAAADVRRRQDPEARIAQAILGIQGTPESLIDRRIWRRRRSQGGCFLTALARPHLREGRIFDPKRECR